LEMEMAYAGEFVVDWFISDTDLRSDAAVAVRHKSKKIGLYRVKEVGRDFMTLSHGGISFPVGTQLEVEDYQRLMPRSPRPLAARVVQNNQQGIHLAW
ncbi:MAG TPA: hypothetical protein VEP67_09170, partial [Thiobacillaceae bacterium]|nr:hypothetical protein [Thiobacillaceae bacterium]